MVPIIQFVFFILGALIQLLIWAIIISAIMSWLVAFNVVNVRNRVVDAIYRGLEAVTRPVMRPFQRIIPPLGGIDISPIIVILVLTGVQGYLLPPLGNYLIGLVG